MSPLAKEQQEAIDFLLKTFSAQDSNLPAFVEAVQERLNWVPEEALQAAADYFKVSYFSVLQAVSFYPQISLEPQGKVVVKVCRGLACSESNSKAVLEDYAGCLGIKPGETTADGQFTLKNSFCFGRCAIGPNVKINQDFFANQQAGLAKDVLKKYSGTQ